MLNSLRSRIQEESARLKERINEQVERTINSMNLVRKSDIDEVLDRLEKLEKRLDEIQSQEA